MKHFAILIISVLLVSVLMVFFLNGQNSFNDLVLECDDLHYQIYELIDTDDLEYSYNMLRQPENVKRIERIGEIIRTVQEEVEDEDLPELDDYHLFNASPKMSLYSIYYDGLSEIISYESDYNDLDEIQYMYLHFEIEHFKDDYEQSE